MNFMGYILYSRDPDPKKREPLKEFATAQEAAKQLGLTPKQVTNIASNSKKGWDSPYLGSRKGSVIILATEDNRGVISHSKEKAFELIEGGCWDAKELGRALDVSIMTAKKYLGQYETEIGTYVGRSPVKGLPKECGWVRWFKEEWQAATAKLRRTDRRRKRKV